MTGSEHRRKTPPPFRLARAAALLLVMTAAPGCRSLWDTSSMKDDDLTRRLAGTDNVKGPLERFALNKKRDDEVLVNPLLASQGRPEYEEGERLFDAGKYEEAEKVFKKISKRHKHAPVREDALFMIAECQFARKRYAWAQDSYDRLVKDYPSTRYLDRFAKRQFEIAGHWLQSPQVVTGDAIKQVNYEDPRKSEPLEIAAVPTRDPTRIVPILPNFFDRSRPVFDTNGRALQALKSIWLNDPTGPLADDALMLSASYYLGKEDWTEADRLYTLLRDEYPKSPHLENSYVLGSHCKLMSYQGPAYDGHKLHDAKQLKETTLRIFPKHPDRERMLDEIRRIEEMLARHEWEMIEYYQRKRRPDAVAVYCRTIVDVYPSTTYGDRARQLLTELEASGKATPKLPPDMKPIPRPKPKPQKEESPEYDDQPPGNVQL